MSYTNDNNNPDISRVFAQNVEKKFQRDFGRYYPPNVRKEQQIERKSNELSVKLIEAEEKVDSLNRQLKTKNQEIEKLKRQEYSASERANELFRQNAELKTEFERNKRTSKNSNEHKLKEKLLIDDYRSALTKCKTWLSYSEKQLVIMKTLLEESGGWTEHNRYRIYFAYRDVKPFVLDDEKVSQLASGSIQGYRGIEDIESISSSIPRVKCHNAFTQTETSSIGLSSTDEFILQTPDSILNNSLTSQEIRLIENDNNILRLQSENAQLKDQIIILREKVGQMVLLELKDEDLQEKMKILKEQNKELILEHEKLKEKVFSDSSMSRSSAGETIKNMVQLRERNQELEKKVKQLELQPQGASIGESKRIAQFFKEKYEKEISDLKDRLSKYEPSHSSDTTRILRFQAFNPLDEAIEDHLVREAAVAAASTPSAKAFKRRKLDYSAMADEGNFTNFLESNDPNQAEIIRDLHSRVKALKNQLDQSTAMHGNAALRQQELVAHLLGYIVRSGEDGFCEVESAIKPDCVFLFQKRDECDAVDLLDNECAQSWKDVMEMYLKKYNSIPSFLSAVTIALVESEEYASQASQNSQQK